MAFTPALTLQPIITCLGQDLSQAYMETYVRDPTLIGFANDTTTPAVTKVEKPAGAEAGTTKVQNVSAGGRLAWGRWAALVVLGVAMW